MRIGKVEPSGWPVIWTSLKLGPDLRGHDPRVPLSLSSPWPRERFSLSSSTACTSECRCIHDWNIANCDIRQQFNKETIPENRGVIVTGCTTAVSFYCRGLYYYDKNKLQEKDWNFQDFYIYPNILHVDADTDARVYSNSSNGSSIIDFKFTVKFSARHGHIASAVTQIFGLRRAMLDNLPFTTCKTLFSNWPFRDNCGTYVDRFAVCLVGHQK